MSESSTLAEIAHLRERLLPEVRGPIQWPEPVLRLKLESRRASNERMFKHIHQSCLLHTENFRAASKVKHVYLLDAYIESARNDNPFAIYMAARSMLEFNAFLHDVSARLCEATNLASQQWLDGGRKFFGIVVRARYATSRSEFKALLRQEGLTDDFLKPMNVMNSIRVLSEEDIYRDTEARYDSLCDYVHHNLGSATAANVGTTIAHVARSIGGGMLIMPDAGPVTQYQYPVPSKGKRGLDDTEGGFLKDAKACIEWINRMPATPYSSEQISAFTGSALGMTELGRAIPAIIRKPVGSSKNGPCPCGSGRKYKRCCGAS